MSNAIVVCPTYPCPDGSSRNPDDCSCPMETDTFTLGAYEISTILVIYGIINVFFGAIATIVGVSGIFKHRKA